MALRKISFSVCLVVLVLCLSAGYGLARQWAGAVMAVMTGLAWLLARKYPAFGLPLICLLVSVGLAVIGQLTGSPSLLMIFSSGMALAVWDLLLLDAALGRSAPGEQTRQYENKHLRSLGLALGAGFSVALLGRLLTLQIPFVWLVLFVVLAVCSLDRVWGQIRSKER